MNILRPSKFDVKVDYGFKPLVRTGNTVAFSYGSDWRSIDEVAELEKVDAFDLYLKCVIEFIPIHQAIEQLKNNK